MKHFFILLALIIYASVFSESSSTFSSSTPLLQSVSLISYNTITTSLNQLPALPSDRTLNDKDVDMLFQKSLIYFSIPDSQHTCLSLVNTSLRFYSSMFHNDARRLFATLDTNSKLFLFDVQMVRSSDHPLIVSSSSFVHMTNISFHHSEHSFFSSPLVNSLSDSDVVKVEKTSIRSIQTACRGSFLCSRNTNSLVIQDCIFINISTVQAKNTLSSQTASQLTRQPESVFVSGCFFDTVTNPFTGTVYHSFYARTTHTIRSVFNEDIQDKTYSGEETQVLESSTTFQSCSFKDCYTGEDAESTGGGAIRLIVSPSSSRRNAEGTITLIITDCKFLRCQANASTYCCGGALYISASGSPSSVYLQMNDTVISRCTAKYAGGGMYINAPCNLMQTEFKQCTAGFVGGGILVELTDSSASSHSRNAAGPELLLVTSSLVLCTATGAVSAAAGHTSMHHGSGGGMAVISLPPSARITIDDCYMFKSKAQTGEGGCIYLGQTDDLTEDSLGIVYFKDTSFLNNEAMIYGHDIAATASWKNVLVKNNFDESSSLSSDPRVTIRKSTSASHGSFRGINEEEDDDVDVLDLLSTLTFTPTDFFVLVLIIALFILAAITVFMVFFCCAYWIPRKEEEEKKKKRREKAGRVEKVPVNTSVSQNGQYPSNAQPNFQPGYPG